MTREARQALQCAIWEERLLPDYAKPKHIIVRCMDGNVRHEEPFTTMREAQHWAWWGHLCAAHHEYEEHDPS